MTPLTRRSYYAVGQFVGQDQFTLAERDAGHRIRIGDRIERLRDATLFAVWERFRAGATSAGPQSADADELASAFPELSWYIADLVGRGLLISDPHDLGDLDILARSHAAVPLLSGLDCTDQPNRYRVGIPTAYAVELSPGQFELWTALSANLAIAGLVERLWLLAGRPVDQDEVARRTLGTLDAVAELAALGVAYLDAV